MKKFGYEQYDLKSIVCKMAFRYSYYMKTKRTFPHEIGLVLGYPVEDVVGFINNQGKNYILTGYWKVYANKESAQVIFDHYYQSKQTLISMVSQGISVNHILEMYYVE